MSTTSLNSQSYPDHRQLLLEAAAQFSAWVQTQAPGAVVMLCGGLALTQYGDRRTTQDADLCMDLRRARRAGTGRTVDTNALKDIAEQDARLVVGPKIYWKHQPSGMYVQVDFMVDRSLPLPSLNLPTLLVGKLKCALERHQADARERRAKQANDVSDVDFIVVQCIIRQIIPLTMQHLAHLGGTPQLYLATIKEFGRLRREVLGPSGMDSNAPSWTVNWRDLAVVVSRLSEELANVATSA